MDPPKEVSRVLSISKFSNKLKRKANLFMILSYLLISTLVSSNYPRIALASSIQSTSNENSHINSQLTNSPTNDGNDKSTVGISGLPENNLEDKDEKCPNKSTSASATDQWIDFAFEEYDLMDYLQNLSAKYKNVNLNQQQQQFAALSPSDELNSGEPKVSQDSSLEGKRENLVEEVKKLILSDPATSNAASQSVSTTLNPTSKSFQASSSTQGPDLVATSLASEPLADHEMGESSWQYGIFDRFTRPRSTTTTPDPKFTLDPHSKIDMRQFNSDECGLRTYDPRDQLGDRQVLSSNGGFYPIQPLEDTLQDQGAIKELNHRRQRPANFIINNGNGPLSIADFSRWQQMESVYNKNQQDQYQASASSSSDTKQIANWPNKDEKDNYDNYKSQILDQHQVSPSAISANGQQQKQADEEFNLLARRNWLQQQLGNTLQMFASINSTSLEFLTTNNGTGNPVTSAPLVTTNSSQVSATTERENMMKKSGNLRLAKSSIFQAPLVSLLNGKSASSEKKSAILAGLEAGVNELKARQDELKLEPRVIGGNDARLGDSPWSVSLQALVSRPGTGQVEYRHYCGGTIISEHYILTAAHCLDFMVGRESRLFVVIGDLNWRMSAASQFGRRFGIDKLIIHSGYKNTAFGHDIGLIRTKEPMRPLKVNGRYVINSVCLPEKGVEHTGEAELVGWGLFSNRNEMADALQIAEVPILPRPLCVDLYRRRTGLIQWLIGIELITEKQVCAGTFGRGICQGDSGSALVFNEKIPAGQAGSSGAGNHLSPPMLRRHTDDSRATIIGVVAFGGIRRCSYQSLPGVYMQTSKYMDWILPRIQA